MALPETELDKACSVAERIRQTIEQLEVAYNQHRIRLTSSFGVATHCGDVDVDYLLKDADKALYAAKAQGRNRVCVSERQVINLG